MKGDKPHRSGLLFIIGGFSLKRVFTPLIIVALLSVCGCAHTVAPVTDHHFRTVSFPHVALAEGERIQSVEIVMTCGRVRAINHIPNDWWVTLEGPVSEVSTLKVTAGHGSTSLWSSRGLDGFITILVCEPSCFTIKATMVAFIGEQERTISFKQSELVMKTPNKLTELAPVMPASFRFVLPVSRNHWWHGSALCRSASQ